MPATKTATVSSGNRKARKAQQAEAQQALMFEKAANRGLGRRERRRILSGKRLTTDDAVAREWLHDERIKQAMVEAVRGEAA